MPSQQRKRTNTQPNTPQTLVPEEPPPQLSPSMTKLNTASPLSRRIAASFLHFLNSVEPAPGVDSEALEVARECLTEVFKVDPSQVESQSNCDSLIDIFSSREGTARYGINNVGASDVPSTSLARDDDVPEASRSSGEDWTREAHSLGKDELFGQFFGALEKIHYFKSMPDGKDDHMQLDRATHIFHNAVDDMQKSGCERHDLQNLAETLKSQGNKAMQSKLYNEAIELYTFAIALCEDNAVYYCNRAAAYTQTHQYAKAVQDCLKSIEINPNYSKAYSRLGFAYYAQGKYRDAIDKGFMKALQLDPSNDSVKENIRVAEQKLKEEQQRAGRDQSSSSENPHGESNHQSGGGSWGPAPPPPFTSMPFNIDGLPADITSMFTNMATNAFQGSHFQNGPERDSGSDSPNEPGIRIGGNINVGEIPEEISGALRSVMGMFSGAAPQRNPQDNTNGRSAPS
ncbi:Tetratricopeptide repeat (TPR)-like superfamily protein [Forsythia ovata]|uniref:Tetratricopeptide repeat (TPR)-like superfamily protein n=1 Tax=Forsythia ovata TaxID=205694 RepID=A0ABD1U4T3_9LAMI